MKLLREETEPPTKRADLRNKIVSGGQRFAHVADADRGHNLQNESVRRFAGGDLGLKGQRPWGKQGRAEACCPRAGVINAAYLDPFEPCSLLKVARGGTHVIGRFVFQSKRAPGGSGLNKGAMPRLPGALSLGDRNMLRSPLRLCREPLNEATFLADQGGP